MQGELLTIYKEFKIGSMDLLMLLVKVMLLNGMNPLLLIVKLLFNQLLIDIEANMRK